MKLWDFVKQALHPSETKVDETFTLRHANESGVGQAKEASNLATGLVRRIDRLLTAKGDPEQLEKVGDLSGSLSENVEALKALFRAPQNKDFIVREFVIATTPPVKAALLYMDGLADSKTINDFILSPLMLQAHLDHHLAGADLQDGATPPDLAVIHRRLVPGHQTAEVPDVKGVATHILSGDTVLIFEGSAIALSIETKGFPSRGVGKAENERLVKGPQDAFTEGFRPNAALIRRRLKDPRVVTEMLTVGRVSNTTVALMYIDTICNPQLIEEVKKRIEAIDVDHVADSGTLGQYIVDTPGSIMTQMLSTERPDRVAAFMSEGHLAVLVDNSPNVLVVPISFWSLLHSPEDYYLPFPFGTLLRSLRFFALAVAMLLPASYLAAVNFHQEMIPTELLLFIASTREIVPMPAAVEIIAMDLAWELIREASTRVPSVVGSTMGLVAGLILGNAAVEARLVSPILVVVIALTGLAAFAIPSYVGSAGIRAARFIFLIAAAFQGFFGIAIVFFVGLLYVASLKSFGVPYLAPVAPYTGNLKDWIIRAPVFTMETRPDYVRTGNQRRQARNIRSWDPNNPLNREKPDGGEE